MIAHASTAYTIEKLLIIVAKPLFKKFLEIG
jgi:hypothetical protein